MISYAYNIKNKINQELLYYDGYFYLFYTLLITFLFEFFFIPFYYNYYLFSRYYFECFISLFKHIKSNIIVGILLVLFRAFTFIDYLIITSRVFFYFFIFWMWFLWMLFYSFYLFNLSNVIKVNKTIVATVIIGIIFSLMLIDDQGRRLIKEKAKLINRSVAYDLGRH